MDERSWLRDVNERCRAAIRDRTYSPDLSAVLVGWLAEPNAAVSDIAGRALTALGPQAFDDLLAHVTGPGGALWPNAVWALALFPDQHARLLPLVRSWLAGAADVMLEQQCAVSLAHILQARHGAGHPVSPADVAACRRVLERDAARHPGIRVHLRALVRWQGPGGAAGALPSPDRRFRKMSGSMSGAERRPLPRALVVTEGFGQLHDLVGSGSHAFFSISGDLGVEQLSLAWLA